MSQAVSDGVTFSELDARKRYSAIVSRDAPGSLMSLPTIAVYPRFEDSASMQEGIPPRTSKTTTTGHNARPHSHQQQVNSPQADSFVRFVVLSSDESDTDSEDMQSEPVTSGEGEEGHDVDVDIEMENDLDGDHTPDLMGSEILAQA